MDFYLSDYFGLNMVNIRSRLLQIGLIVILVSIGAGCSSVGASENCKDLYRDITIDRIDQQSAQFNLAGKITEKRPNEDWLLITDGTGVAKVYPRSNELMRQPKDTCIEFTARVGTITDGGKVDVIMYLGEYIKS